MKQIPLSLGYSAIVDDEDFEVLSAKRWRALVHGNSETMRVYAVHDSMRMHRVIWEMAHGPIPTGREIDHVEPGYLGGLDNRRANLRLCNKQQNQANSRLSRNNTSGFKGVWWQKQARRWRVDVTVNGRKQHVGYFVDKEAAARAYDKAAVGVFGEFARTNFPQEAA